MPLTLMLRFGVYFLLAPVLVWLSPEQCFLLHSFERVLQFGLVMRVLRPAGTPLIGNFAELISRALLIAHDKGYDMVKHNWHTMT